MIIWWLYFIDSVPHRRTWKRGGTAYRKCHWGTASPCWTAYGPIALTEMEAAKRESLIVQRKTAPDRYLHQNFQHWSRSHNKWEQMQNCGEKNMKTVCERTVWIIEIWIWSDIASSYRENKWLEMFPTLKKSCCLNLKYNQINCVKSVLKIYVVQFWSSL